MPATIANPQPQAHEGDDMDPMQIDLSRALRIGFSSSIADGRSRWTEIAIWYLTDAKHWRRPWVSEVIGRSTVEGERDKRSVVAVGSLERAVKLFDDSDLARVAILQAEQWREENADRLRRRPTEDALPTTDAEMLAWLYPGSVLKNWPVLIERDFGTGESTTRAALKNGTDVKVPLRAVLRWFDREAFQRDREAGAWAIAAEAQRKSDREPGE